MKVQYLYINSNNTDYNEKEEIDWDSESDDEKSGRLFFFNIMYILSILLSQQQSAIEPLSSFFIIVSACFCVFLKIFNFKIFCDLDLNDVFKCLRLTDLLKVVSTNGRSNGKVWQVQLQASLELNFGTLLNKGIWRDVPLT